MSNISQLVNFIDRRRTYDEVKAKAYDIDPLWRESSWSRALRSYKSILAVKPNGVIVAYEPSNNLDRAKAFKEVSKNLNEDLKELLKNIELSFDNLNKVKEINSAIKSNNDYYKKEVIKKYYIKV